MVKLPFFLNRAQEVCCFHLLNLYFPLVYIGFWWMRGSIVFIPGPCSVLDAFTPIIYKRYKVRTLLEFHLTRYLFIRDLLETKQLTAEQTKTLQCYVGQHTIRSDLVRGPVLIHVVKYAF